MRSYVKTSIGILLSLLLLWWVLRDVSAAEVLSEIRTADPLLFAVAIALQIALFWFRAVRWGILLRPMVPGLPFYPRWAATLVGFAANNVLPARVGEIARALSLSRLTPVPIAASVATLVIERVLDGLVIVGLLLAAMALPGFPLEEQVVGIDPRGAAMFAGGFMVLVAAMLLMLVSAPALSLRLVRGLAERLLPVRLRGRALAVVESFLSGLGALRHGGLLAASLLLAVGQWVTGAVSFWAGFRAFGIDAVPFTGAAFLQSLTALAVAVPSSPGFFGPFEAAAKLGLSLWAVPADKAVSFAVGFHIGGFVPVTVLGLYYVARLGLSWREVRDSEDVVGPDAHSDPPEGRAALHEGC